jgi:MFS family permease
VANDGKKGNFPKPRLAVSVAFLINGAATGTFVSRIADYKHELSVSPFAFGFALLFVAIGVLSGLSPAGRLSARYGSSAVTFPASIFLSLTIILISLTKNYIEFIIFLFLYGAASAIQDVAMNTHALTIEEKYQSKYMSVFHGLWSLGSLIFVFLGSFASQKKVPTYYHATAVAFICVMAIVFVQNWFLPASADIHEITKNKEADHQSQKAVKVKKFIDLGPRIFIILGLLGICGQIGEGATGDWGSILARETYRATPFVANLPYVFFCISMVIGRLNGDRLRKKISDRFLLQLGGALAGIGMIGAMLIGKVIGEIIGWLVAGLGLSILIPILFALAGKIASRDYPNKVAPARAVAKVSGLAYSGFMAGPPIIGFFASQITLRWALLIPGVLALFITVGASRVIKV